MNIHHYDATTKVYKRTTTAIEGHGTPANATTTALPTIADGYQAVFNENTGSWTIELIPAVPASVDNPLTEFSNMTIAQKLVHYGLGDLVSHIIGQTTLAKKSTVDAQISHLQDQITAAKADISAMGTTNATVTANQQLIAELTEDINTTTASLELES